MGVFGALTTHTVTVARLDTAATNVDGDLTYGEQVRIRVRVRKRLFRDQKYGRMIDEFTKILTEDWEFKKTDAVWLPGADTSDPTKAKNPRTTMTHSTMGVRVSSAEF